MKVAYITINENIVSPLLKRQLIELLVEMKKSDELLEMFLISSIPIHLMFKLRKDLHEVKIFLKESNIKFFIYPLLIPFPYFKLEKTDKGLRPSFKWTSVNTKLAVLGIFPILVFLRYIKKINIFHCRSYPSSYSVSVFKKITSKIKFIFDPRSDFPEENVISGTWDINSNDFLFWKKAEKEILENADSVACIANTYVNHYNNVHTSEKYFIAPNNVDINTFKRSNEQRFEIRNKYKINDDEILFCYLGVISRNGWNRYSVYIDFLDLLKNANFKYKVLFLVPDYSVNELMLELQQHNYIDRCLVLNVEYNDIPNYLSACDVGLYFLYEKSIRVGTKLGEYNVNGLPVVINGNCLGSIEVIKMSGCGVILDNDKESSLRLISELIDDGLNTKAIQDFGVYYFSNEKVSKIYLNQYKNI